MDCPPPPSNSRAVEEQWEQRVRAAKLWYEMAVAEAELLDARPNRAALSRARRNAENARLELLRTLETFTDLIINGQLPGRAAAHGD